LRRAKTDHKDQLNRINSFAPHKSVTNIAASGVPNQRLKLTESTVDDFAARCGTIRQMATPHARMRYDDLASRRRSLAAIR